MKKKRIPIIIVLIAASISSISSVIQGVSIDIFTKRLLLSVLCFAIIGIVLRIIIEKAFPSDTEEEEQMDEEDVIDEIEQEIHSGDEE